MNRKIAAAVIAMILSVGLCGCSDAEKTQNDNPDNPPEIVEQTGENTEESGEEIPADAPSFETICDANSAENLLEKLGSFRYLHEYNGEPDGLGEKIFTKDGTFEEEHFYEDWESDEYTVGYVFTGKNSVYRNYDGETFAVLDVTDDYLPDEFFEWYASEFYGYDPADVEKIEKIDGGWKITFKGDAESAQFFADEYHEGDLFVVEEYVDDDLIYVKCDQIMRYADGHDEVMNSTKLEKRELPEIGKQLSDLATAEETVKATVFIDHGCGYTESHSITMAKGSAVKVNLNHFKLFADEAHTTPIGDSDIDTSKDVIVYALSPIADYISKEDFVNGNIGQTMIRGYDANGEQIASDGRYFDGTNPSGYSVSGELDDENIAYFEFTTYDADGNEISTVKVEKQ